MYIVHRGQAGFGHYWLYQRNLPDERQYCGGNVSGRRARVDVSSTAEQYLKFNDEQVTRVDSHEVLGDTSGSNANPYLLVYVKKGATGIRTFTRTDPNGKFDNVAAADQQLQGGSMSMDVDPDLKSGDAPVPSASEGDVIPADQAATITTAQKT